MGPRASRPAQTHEAGLEAGGPRKIYDRSRMSENFIFGLFSAM